MAWRNTIPPSFHGLTAGAKSFALKDIGCELRGDRIFARQSSNDARRFIYFEIKAIRRSEPAHSTVKFIAVSCAWNIRGSSGS
jgi:hypothetical protein